MSGAAKGLLLAMLNVVVVAVGLATTITREGVEIAVLAVYIGLIPAVITGLVVGRIAETLPRFRLPVIVAIPIAVVLCLGVLAKAVDAGGEPVISSAVIGFACIPTTVGAIILERWTRMDKPQPVPPAIVA